MCLSRILVWATCEVSSCCRFPFSSMVRLPRSRYESHPQVRYQGCSLYSSLQRSLFLRTFSPLAGSLVSHQPDRRKGFPNRATAVMFIMTVVNFLLSNLRTGSEVAGFIMSIRKMDISYPLSEKSELVNSALRNFNIVGFWATDLPVSLKSSLLDPIFIHARWRYISAISLSFGGLGCSSQIDSG